MRVCACAVGLKYKFGLDDSLDVVGVHLVGGIVGTVLIGFFCHLRRAHGAASTACSTAAASTSLGDQALGALIAIVWYSASFTTIIGLAIKYTIGLADRRGGRGRGHRLRRAR